MVIPAIVLVVMSVAWLVAMSGVQIPPAVRRAGIAFVVVCVSVTLALSAGPAGAAVFLFGLGSFAIWWRTRKPGEDEPGGWDDDDRDPRRDPPPHVFDPDAFDRARAEWERELADRG